MVKLGIKTGSHKVFEPYEALRVCKNPPDPLTCTLVSSIVDRHGRLNIFIVVLPPGDPWEIKLYRIRRMGPRNEWVVQQAPRFHGSWWIWGQEIRWTSFWQQSWIGALENILDQDGTIHLVTTGQLWASTFIAVGVAYINFPEDDSLPNDWQCEEEGIATAGPFSITSLELSVLSTSSPLTSQLIATFKADKNVTQVTFYFNPHPDLDGSSHEMDERVFQELRRIQNSQGPSLSQGNLSGETSPPPSDADMILTRIQNFYPPVGPGAPFQVGIYEVNILGPKPTVVPQVVFVKSILSPFSFQYQYIFQSIGSYNGTVTSRPSWVHAVIRKLPGAGNTPIGPSLNWRIHVFALFTNESNALNGGPGNHYGNQLWHIQSMDSDGGGGVVRDRVGRNVFDVPPENWTQPVLITQDVADALDSDSVYTNDQHGVFSPSVTTIGDTVCITVINNQYTIDLYTQDNTTSRWNKETISASPTIYTPNTGVLPQLCKNYMELYALDEKTNLPMPYTTAKIGADTCTSLLVNGVQITVSPDEGPAPVTFNSAGLLGISSIVKEEEPYSLHNMYRQKIYSAYNNPVPETIWISLDVLPSVIRIDLQMGVGGILEILNEIQYSNMQQAIKMGPPLKPPSDNLWCYGSSIGAIQSALIEIAGLGWNMNYLKTALDRQYLSDDVPSSVARVRYSFDPVTLGMLSSSFPPGKMTYSCDYRGGGAIPQTAINSTFNFDPSPVGPPLFPRATLPTLRTFADLMQAIGAQESYVSWIRIDSTGSDVKVSVSWNGASYYNDLEMPPGSKIQPDFVWNGLITKAWQLGNLLGIILMYGGVFNDTLNSWLGVNINKSGIATEAGNFRSSLLAADDSVKSFGTRVLQRLSDRSIFDYEKQIPAKVSNASNYFGNNSPSTYNQVVFPGTTILASDVGATLQFDTSWLFCQYIDIQDFKLPWTELIDPHALSGYLKAFDDILQKILDRVKTIDQQNNLSDLAFLWDSVLNSRTTFLNMTMSQYFQAASSVASSTCQFMRFPDNDIVTNFLPLIAGLVQKKILQNIFLQPLSTTPASTSPAVISLYVSIMGTNATVDVAGLLSMLFAIPSLAIKEVFPRTFYAAPPPLGSIDLIKSFYGIPDQPASVRNGDAVSDLLSGAIQAIQLANPPSDPALGPLVQYYLQARMTTWLARYVYRRYDAALVKPGLLRNGPLDDAFTYLEGCSAIMLYMSMLWQVPITPAVDAGIGKESSLRERDKSRRTAVETAAATGTGDQLLLAFAALLSFRGMRTMARLAQIKAQPSNMVAVACIILDAMLPPPTGKE